MKYDRILVAMDGSAGGRSAAEAAASLARAFDAEIIVLHVSNEPTVIGSVGAIEVPDEVKVVYDEVSAHVLDEGQHIIERHGLGGEMISVPGDAADMILDVAEARNVDVIVMGHRGLSRVERFLLGSVSQKVVNHAECGVLLVPEVDTEVEHGTGTTV